MNLLDLFATQVWLLSPAFVERIQPIIIGLYNKGQLNIPQIGEAPERSIDQPQKQETDIVAHVPIWGTMTKKGGMSAEGTQTTIARINAANEANEVSSILLDIESNGGTVDGMAALGDAIRGSHKPVVAYVDAVAASAAYWAATGADTIFASRNSDVGSIGVTMSYLDYSDQNAKEGIKYISLSSGKFKDAGDPDKPLTEEEKELFMRDVGIIHDNFVKVVADYRNLDIEKVREIADGSTVLGETALELGLIDRIGGFYDVKDYLAEMLGEEVKVCW